MLYVPASLPRRDRTPWPSYTATLVLGSAFGGLGWGAWADRAGNKVVLLASTACAVFAGAFALFAPSPLAFGGVFVALALATAGVGLAGNNIVMEYAGGARDIALYTTIYNTVTAVPRAVAPLLGGLLADRLGGYGLLFPLSAVLALASLAFTLRAAGAEGGPPPARPAPAPPGAGGVGT